MAKSLFAFFGNKNPLKVTLAFGHKKNAISCNDDKGHAQKMLR